jgi:hypothetical protein
MESGRHDSALRAIGCPRAPFGVDDAAFSNSKQCTQHGASVVVASSPDLASSGAEDPQDRADDDQDHADRPQDGGTDQ